MRTSEFWVDLTFPATLGTQQLTPRLEEAILLLVDGAALLLIPVGVWFGAISSGLYSCSRFPSHSIQASYAPTRGILASVPCGSSWLWCVVDV